MYNSNRPAIAVGTVTVHGAVTSAYIDGVGVEVAGAYDLCKKNLTLRGKVQVVLTDAVKALSAYGKAEIVNGDRIMFVADLAKVGVEQGHVKEFALNLIENLSKDADLEVDIELDAAEAVSWINYVPAEDGSYTLASAYGNAWFMINGDLASQRKARRAEVTGGYDRKPAEQTKPAETEKDSVDNLVDTICPNPKED